MAELQEFEEVKGLVARGQQVGVLTYAEIATATAELALDEADVEECTACLSAMRSSWSMRSTQRPRRA
ncbi:MAG: RNA polymerase sigma factor region1.1 domain-containing protein [Solirubrobacteraceae bacterium]|jgi:RNA polymerase primary sigma factor